MTTHPGGLPVDGPREDLRLRSPRCLVYAPYSFSGRGVAESCAQLVGPMPSAGLAAEVHLGRRRTALAPGVRVRQPVPVVGGLLPWRHVEGPALSLLERQFRHAVDRADPTSTLAWFWPGSPVSAVKHARERGLITVREMINSAMAVAGPILDAAYRRLGLLPTHGITADWIRTENEELALYDYVFASNPEVERSLAAAGVESRRILPTSFGWSPARFADAAAGAFPRAAAGAGHGTFRAVFVGRIGVRKGVPELLAAWKESGVDGELVLVGSVDDEVEELVAHHVATGRVRLAGFVANPAEAYAAADVFVFPTLEEGGPQVTYEAAGCGLPVITTPMGAARLVENGRSGIVVDPGEPSQLAHALRTLAGDTSMREAYGIAAREAAQRFTYAEVGARRAAMLTGRLTARPEL